MTCDDELEALKDEILGEMSAFPSLLAKVGRYWAKRAEKASRGLCSFAGDDAHHTAANMCRGQISICYETADVVGRTLESLEAKARAEGVDGTSGDSSVV